MLWEVYWTVWESNTIKDKDSKILYNWHFTWSEANLHDKCNYILAHIKQFCPERAGVSPETYIWETLISSVIENEITNAARSISYIDDTHRYMRDIIDQLGLSKEVG